MLNYNNRGQRRVQNIGVNNVSTFATELATRLEKPSTKKFTAKSFRRSACAQLVEVGISIIGLYQAGNWKSVSTVREYTEHSTTAVTLHIDILDGKRLNITACLHSSKYTISVIFDTRYKNKVVNYGTRYKEIAKYSN